jgi:hypothetical protein
MNTHEKQIGPYRIAGNVIPLSILCKRVIAFNLERYPAHAFISLAETEWDSIIQLKYKLTQPKATYLKPGNATLSGGRKMPVMSDKFISDIEIACPALAGSTVVDDLVWKDCTNYKFKINGPLRPSWLELPWEVRIEQTKQVGIELMKHMGELGGRCNNEEDLQVLQQNLSLLETRPMSIALLSNR